MKNVLNKCSKKPLKLNNNSEIFLQVNTIRLNIQFFYEFLLVTIQEEALADVYERICEVIEQEDKVDHAWIPSKEKI